MFLGKGNVGWFLGEIIKICFNMFNWFIKVNVCFKNVFFWYFKNNLFWFICCELFDVRIMILMSDMSCFFLFFFFW